uniref:glycosyltransferase family 4 protein n=1 Tax=Altererythrobacter segetis TaxID=1104773 RepID=UPI00140C5227|nr:glycosyltransferase family 4 protein [Altererythrobacter segetis]
MKIAVVLAGGVDRDGTTRVIPCVLWLIRRLVEAGDEVHVFAMQQEPEPGRWRLLGASVYNAGSKPRSLRIGRAIAAEHWRGRFDAIHAFGSWTGAIAGLLGRLLRVPVILTFVGGELARVEAAGYGGQRTASGRAVVELAAKCARVVTVQSEFMRKLADGIGIAAVRLTLGVSTRDWRPSPPRPRMAGVPLRILHIASLNRVKDQASLLLAMARLRDLDVDCQLSIVGWDALGGAVRRQAEALELGSRVRFCGFLPHRELRDRLDEADLLVMTSLHEGGPLVVLEAAMAGVPTVGTAVGHLADLSPAAALCSPPGDPAALADNIRRIAGDEPLRMSLAAAAHTFAMCEDADFTAAAFRKLYFSS